MHFMKNEITNSITVLPTISSDKMNRKFSITNQYGEPVLEFNNDSDVIIYNQGKEINLNEKLDKIEILIMLLIEKGIINKSEIDDIINSKIILRKLKEGV